MTNPADQGNLRYRYIDSLRGLAALSVIVYHIVEFTPPSSHLENIIRQILFQQLDLGKIAVTLFFAISGYVVPFSLLRPSEKPLFSFAISRIFRLYPAYWVSILVGVITLFGPPYHIPIIEVLVNISMLQQFFGIQNVVGVYWTLQIELIFYALCAILFYFGLMGNNRRILQLIILLTAVAFMMGGLRFMTGKNLPTALPLALSIMFYGYLYRQSQSIKSGKISRSLSYIPVLFLFSYPAIFVLSYGDLWLNYFLTYFISLASFLMGTSVLKINSKALAYTGKISYSLYLFGSLAGFLAPKFLVAAGFQTSVLSIIFLSFLIAIPFSSFIYHFVELPFIRLGRKIDLSMAQSAKANSLIVKRSS